ncbi:DRTGG domain-containing protein [Paenibacillus alkalitolerans]|uniref:DRTGG domain-containing protein n=1 Tax=Paenibacillus alkalitolerans TaxID=2799335 RepID=UPI0018F3484D|nr:DRTGG domain-containing protein [Paenibacillus alkalitolerans]
MDTTLHESLTKHEQIIRYIQSLRTGSKISVRKIARDVGVSEGTAYRAIKEAEASGLVATKERIGTVRIEQKARNNIDKLTFAEVVNIVDGTVLGGAEGLQKSLGKFVIGAMELEAMVKYIDAGSLLIVGNRVRAHSIALELGAGILITGGFPASDEVKELADQLALPIISSSYDTFTVASLINRAIYDRLIKKKILLVEDIMVSGSHTSVLKGSNTVADWNALVEESGHSRFPVVDEWNRIIGMVTSKDVVGAAIGEKIEKVMTRNPITVTPRTSVASAAHMMVWEGIELLPVTDTGRKLAGVISRQDVLKGMQFIQKQPQIGETIEEIILSAFQEEREADGGIAFRGIITPQMTSSLGTVSEGVLTTLMSQAAFRAIKLIKKGDLVLDSMSAFFLKPLQIDNEIVIRPQVIELSRKFGKVDVEIHYRQALVAKAILTAQLIDQA